ncbi:hypothetical protein AHAS_Ahas15G0122900 [Arachis hypogaea]
MFLSIRSNLHHSHLHYSHLHLRVHLSKQYLSRFLIIYHNHRTTVMVAIRITTVNSATTDIAVSIVDTVSKVGTVGRVSTANTQHNQHSRQSQHSHQPILTIPTSHEWFDFLSQTPGDQQQQDWANVGLGGWSDFSVMPSLSGSADPHGPSVHMDHGMWGPASDHTSGVRRVIVVSSSRSEHSWLLTSTTPVHLLRRGKWVGRSGRGRKLLLMCLIQNIHHALGGCQSPPERFTAAWIDSCRSEIIPTPSFLTTCIHRFLRKKCHASAVSPSTKEKAIGTMF